MALAAAVSLAGCGNEPQPISKQPAGTNPPAAAPTNAVATATTNPTTTISPAPAKDEMTTTASGLKYTALKHGTGTVSPKAPDTVTVHYRGTLLNGTEFDSSIGHDPISFPLNRVIPGWTEGLQLMKVGDKFKFEIPANLAYGAHSPVPLLPPNSTLVFEVELVGIQ